MIQLMEWHTGQKYSDKNSKFSDADLLSITADSFLCFLNLMVYDEEYPTLDAVPMTRSSNIEYWKKSSRYYMPNIISVWDVITGRGNPTRSYLRCYICCYCGGLAPNQFKYDVIYICLCFGVLKMKCAIFLMVC